MHVCVCVCVLQCAVEVRLDLLFPGDVQLITSTQGEEEKGEKKETVPGGERREECQIFMDLWLCEKPYDSKGF